MLLLSRAQPRSLSPTTMAPILLAGFRKGFTVFEDERCFMCSNLQ